MRILALAAMVIVATTGCESERHEHGEAHAEVCEASLTHDQYGDAEIVSQPGAKLGDLTRCPISAAVFRVGEDSPKAEQKGETYYTCCGGCVDQLERSFARRR